MSVQGDYNIIKFQYTNHSSHPNPTFQMEWKTKRKITKHPKHWWDSGGTVGIDPTDFQHHPTTIPPEGEVQNCQK